MAELRWGAATDSGRVRTANEDSVLAVAQVFAVADGMGGHAAGEVASAVAVETLARNLTDGTVTLTTVLDAIREANESVYRRSLNEPGARGMGTTLTVIAPVVSDDGRDHLVVANVGDSRSYLFAEGQLRQLTRDHSYVEEMLAAGQITASEARHHPHRHVVTRALGVEPIVAIDSWLVTPEPGDRYIICSDGLVNEVPDDQIAQLLRAAPEPQRAADALVAAANAAGGRDNITVVVVDVVEASGSGDGATRLLAATPADPTTTTAGTTSTTTTPTTGSAATTAPDHGATAVTTATADASGPVGGWLPDELVHGFDDDGPASTTAPPPGATASRPTASAPATAKKRRRVTGKAVLFITLVVAVLVAGFVGIAAFGRSGYYVGYQGDDVAVFQGRPGGLLWFQPTVASVSAVSRDDIGADSQARVARNPTFSSRSAADHFVATLSAEAEAANTTTSTAVPTTSSGSPPIAPTTTRAAVVSVPTTLPAP
jgi:serine/threonine protein phosphatase PrpC